LAIIGVVAAITIPGIMANHQKRTFETQFTKAYRTLQQVVNLAVAEHGDISTWNWQDTWTAESKDEFVKKYFLPHLSVAKYCLAQSEERGCFANENINLLNGKTSIFNLGATPGEPQFILSDGTSIGFNFVSNCSDGKTNCLAIDVELNGAKKPNTLGKDFFKFSFYPKTGVFLPNGIIDPTTYNADTNTYMRRTKEQIDANCNKDGQGWYCPARIVLDGFKINYF